MTALIIIGAIILLFLLLLAPRVYLDLSAGEELSVGIRVFRVIRIRLYPKKQKKPSLSRYSAKKIKKREEKLRLKQAKKDAKAAKKAAEKQQKKEAKKQKEQSGEVVKTPLSEQIHLIVELLKTVLPKFGRALRIDLSHIVIRVASPDAAGTAILYGAISQSVSCLLALLDHITNVKANKDAVVDVTADFLSEKMSADVRISVSVSPLSLIGIAFSALFTLIRVKIRGNSDR